MCSSLSLLCVFRPAVVEVSMAGSKEKLPSAMKAVRLHKYGGPEVLQLDTNVPIPACAAAEVCAAEFSAVCSSACMSEFALMLCEAIRKRRL